MSSVVITDVFKELYCNLEHNTSLNPSCGQINEVIFEMWFELLMDMNSIQHPIRLTLMEEGI